jgi:hypothetical protein
MSEHDDLHGAIVEVQWEDGGQAWRILRWPADNDALELQYSGMTFGKTTAWGRLGSPQAVLRKLVSLHAPEPRPLAEYHEDLGPVLWWLLPVDEPPYVGSPLDSDWQVGGSGPDGAYFTHFTPIQVPRGAGEEPAP